MSTMSKDEFKASMRAAKAEAEINEIMRDIEDPVDDDLIEDPAAFENPEKPGKKRRKTAKTVPNRQKSASNGIKTSKTASVAAEQKTVEEDMTKEQEEALKAMCSLTAGYTQQLIKGAEKNLNTADKLVDMAIIYNGYVETVEGMLK